MTNRLPVLVAACLALLLALAPPRPAQAQDSQLEAALGSLYATCLFEGVQNNPFSQAAALSRASLGPGISNFIESSLASIPLTPPSLDAQYRDGEIVTVVTAFTPIFTESSATVGRGQFLVGSNVSYFNLSSIRGQDVEDLQFAFAQDNGGDLVTATMPFNLDATVFTLYGTYGITDRLDLGVALPVVRLGVENVETTFAVQGSDSGCGYDPGGAGPNCNGIGSPEISVPLNLTSPDLAESETFLNTVAVRAKYRFPSSLTVGSLAAVVDMRLPVGRNEDSLIGAANFGTRLSLIGEYGQFDAFKPYVNLGAQFWNGDNVNSLSVATGFTQRMASKLFFAFDLLGNFEIEDSAFLSGIDNELSPEATEIEEALAGSTIPSATRDHTLNAGLGLQLALSPSFHVYGSALFALLDRGLQSNIAPTGGVSLYF
ncbi:MAG: hypothetical protein GVY18_16165 [Bacteroidetes bacterium]|jgi:hypothetical protein|nr:hypothetical protein [Bacteroidota bacterium]